MNSERSSTNNGKFIGVKCVFFFVGGVSLEESDCLETPLRESVDSGTVVLLALDLGIFLLAYNRKNWRILPSIFYVKKDK
jgi:hypothetical protein